MKRCVEWIGLPLLVAILVSLLPLSAAARPIGDEARPEIAPSTDLFPPWAASLASAAQTLPPPYLSDDDVADAPFDNPPPPVVDGLISPGEYAGAGKVTFPGYGGDVEVFFKQDGTILYVAFELPDKVNHVPVPDVSLFVDTNNDGGTAPQADDFWFIVARNGGVGEWQGTGIGWNATAVTWAWAIAETMSGWSVEFGIPFSKLGITAGTFKELGLALRNGGLSTSHFWPDGASETQPDTWGSLVSSSGDPSLVPSGWDTFYWKPGPWEDYAPSGMPDFDQRWSAWQSGPISTHCGPVAMANSLWWFDSKFETPDRGPLTISDTYRLVTSYNPIQWDDHYTDNVPYLVEDLARYFDTDGKRSGADITGTNVISMFYGLHEYLRDHGLWDDYLVTLVVSPTFEWVADEVMRSEDVVLLLGFYEWQTDHWARVGGHYVNVAGVDPVSGTIAFSDPYLDNAEGGGAGRVLSGTLIAHTPIPGHASHVHNDAGNVSHDVYTTTDTDSPGGVWGPVDYPLAWEPGPFLGANPHPWIPTESLVSGPTQVEVEFALSVSPYTWKASGYWDEETGWVPWPDYAPNGVPDFDQRQDCWGQVLGPCPPSTPVKWSFCGPVAAANSLWWFDGKFEKSPTIPPTYNDSYPLVQSYDGTDPKWDDHDPLNVDDPTTPWPSGGELVEDLAQYFQIDPLGTGVGTVITNLYTGLISYTVDHGLRQGYVITMVQSPDFWWVAEEVEVSEDVILLLGFYEDQDPGPDVSWARVGGHYVTVPGVDKQGGLVAFSDPYFDHAEYNWPYAYPGGYPYWMGRVTGGWLLPHPLPHTTVYTTHNDAGNLSHDVYHIQATDSPGGVWGPGTYTEYASDLENFFGQNGDSVSYTGNPVQTEVDWAVAVSPVADVWITKTVAPTIVGHGDRITFTLVFTNEGSLPAQGVVITDILPSQLVNATWSAWLSNGGSVTARSGTRYVWDVADLAWRDWGVITVTAQVSAADLNLDVTNTVTIATTSIEQYQWPELPDGASGAVAIRNPDIEVAPSSLAATVVVGQRLTRTLTITDAAGAGAPLNWSIGEFPAMGWLSETPSSGTLAPGNGAPVSVTFDATGLSVGIYTTTLRITSDDPDKNPVDVPVTLTVGSYGVSLLPDVATLVANPGDVVTYPMVVWNAGAFFTDTYTLSTAGESWTTSLPASVGPVASGSAAFFTVTVQIPAGASDGDSDTVQVTATSQGDGTQSDTSTLTTRVFVGTITRSLEIEVTPPTVGGDPGDTVCVTVTITNTGNVTDTVNLTHTFPSSWTVTITPPPPYMLGPGESVDVRVCVAIPANASGGGQQEGKLAVTSGGDPTVSEEASVTVRVGWRYIYLPLVMRQYP